MPLSSNAVSRAVLLLALATGAVHAEDHPVVPPAPELSPQQTTQLQFSIMAGELAAGRGQPRVAAQAFLEAIKLQPDAQLAGRATQLALSSGDASLALVAAQQWLQLDSAAMDAREVIAVLSLRQGELEAVHEQCLEIIKGHPGGLAEGFRHVALLLSGEPSRAVAVQSLMDRLVSGYPELAGARYARALAALRFDDLATAERSAREALRLEPDSRDYKILLVGVLVRTGDLAQADTLMDQLLSKARKDRDDLRMTYAKLLLEAGQREHARGQLRAALKDNVKNDDARYALGVLAYNDGLLDEAEQLFSPLAERPDRGADAHYQLGRIAEARKQFPEALAHYEKVTSGSQAIEGAVRRAAVMAKLGRIDEARASLDQLRRQFPPLAVRLTQAEAEVLMEANRLQDSLEVYNNALARDSRDVDMLYGRSLVLERMDRFSEAEADLRAILAQQPDDSRTLNALGYLLTVNTTRYAEAHELIDAALRHAPDDAAVIDSMGWVLFKMGRPDEARPWLQKALDKASDPEISAHLGEVLWVLGERDEARAVWDKALAREPGHPGLSATVERLTR